LGSIDTFGDASSAHMSPGTELLQQEIIDLIEENRVYLIGTSDKQNISFCY
jgi:hypothetical protein